jgi:hypothetical protein
MRRSLYPSGKAVKALSVTTISADGDTNGDGIDRYQEGDNRGNFHGGVVFVALAGTIDDGTYTLGVEVSDNGTDWVAADPYEVQGGGVLDTSNTVAEIGYNGTKRHCRLVVTAEDVDSGGSLGAVAYLEGGSKRPVRNFS